jgi:hypothetical protein
MNLDTQTEWNGEISEETEIKFYKKAFSTPSLTDASNLETEPTCERNCPDFNGMAILHKEQCDCSCHKLSWEIEFDKQFGFFGIFQNEEGEECPIDEVKAFVRELLLKEKNYEK